MPERMRCDRCNQMCTLSYTGICVKCRTHKCDMCGHEFLRGVRNLMASMCNDCMKLPYHKRLALKERMNATRAQ
jgi:hypothetical protein